MEPTLIFATAQEWEDWLAAQPADSAGLWLKLAKKGCDTPSIDYATALESALCFGWIDGRKRPLDESFWLQRFTPRTPRSKWSRINRDRATALIEAGRMRPAGLREVERAREDGRWDAAYESQSSAEVPADLQAALDADPQAAAFFATLDRANRYAVLYRVNEAKRADTRAKRIEKFVAMLHAGETIHPRRTAK
ncbi:YdeI/OmpD-associated family protein [Actinospica sp. MGRD01-02]|uniref:YdeI/OmpD-associated family protein n=1 Tax=Actinospica acidithermotolerans TaxID=2828514 RepID=A0A941E783_9ACTN|nr:YdeI/OmpD-associated family protein [Actinospica acidithermotolerans]MBR7827630.1 YdeI/OmpD-associated family protein [Actinospica acidithermotolerans]